MRDDTELDPPEWDSNENTLWVYVLVVGLILIAIVSGILATIAILKG